MVRRGATDRGRPSQRANGAATSRATILPRETIDPSARGPTVEGRSRQNAAAASESVTALVGYIFSAGGVVALLLVCVVWLRTRPGSRLARRSLLAVAVFYACAGTYAVSHSIGLVLTSGLRPFEHADVSAGPTAIVVLGSGGFTARDWTENRFSVVDPAAATRVLEAVRVFKLIDHAWIISSGGRVDPDDPDEPTGQTMRDALVQLGVPETRIVVETKSRNTYEEAIVVAPLLASMGIRQTVLVTSEIHMRRSLGTFKAAGIDAVPAIARPPFNDLSFSDWVLPSGLGLHQGGQVAHEVLGIAYYAARGWYRS